MNTPIQLTQYSPIYESRTISRISQFFGFHQSLVAGGQPITENSDEDDQQSRGTLTEWIQYPSALFIISKDDIDVGFIRISYRGSIVAWIEDIFVDPDFRKQGIAASAIREAEKIVMDTPGYTAVCLDVAPRNSVALKLYYKLGYTDISLITIRKEFSKSKRDKPVTLFGYDFKY